MLRFLTTVMLMLLVGCSGQPTFTNSHGAHVSMSNLNGHWVIFDYWAVWCDNCHAAVPQLNAFYAEHKNKDIQLYGINDTGLTGNKLRVAIAKMKITYPVLQQNPANYYHLGAIEAIPAMYIINPQGHLVKTLYGPHSKAALDQLMNQLTKVG